MATARVRGTARAIKALDKLKEFKPMKKAIYASALMVEKTAKESIAHGSPSGRMYGDHQASAPGEPPATDSGLLLSSITHKISDDGLSATVGSNLERAAHLEHGTRNMAPRPFLNPALDVNRNAIVERIKKGLAEATKEAAELAAREKV